MKTEIKAKIKAKGKAKGKGKGKKMKMKMVGFTYLMNRVSTVRTLCMYIIYLYHRLGTVQSRADRTYIPSLSLSLPEKQIFKYGCGLYSNQWGHKTGDEETRAGLEREVADFDPDSYTSQQLSLSAIAAAANKVTGKTPAASFKNTRERLLHNPLEGDPSGRQLAESIPDFLAHLPPQTTPTSEAGPWIRIANPFSRVRPLAQDLTAYAGAGARILEALGEAIAAQEAELLGRPQSLRNRKVTRLRKTATEDLLRLAQEHGVTTGKWMLFPSPAEVNAVWRLVADATVSEQLGHAAKVATDSGLGDGESRLVCVYTEDFANVGDVKRVLIKLAEMGLVNRKEAAGEPRGIYYKCGRLYLVFCGRSFR